MGCSPSKESEVPPASQDPWQLAHTGQVKQLRRWIDMGGNPSALDRQGGRGTLLHAAVSGVRLGCIQVLLESGADANAVTKLRGSPLHAAAAHNDSAVAEALLSGGADPMLKNASGKTAIDVALENGNSTTAELMRRKASRTLRVGAGRKKPGPNDPGATAAARPTARPSTPAGAQLERPSGGGSGLSSATDSGNGLLAKQGSGPAAAAAALTNSAGSGGGGNGGVSAAPSAELNSGPSDAGDAAQAALVHSAGSGGSGSGFLGNRPSEGGMSNAPSGGNAAGVVAAGVGPHFSPPSSPPAPRVVAHALGHAQAVHAVFGQEEGLAQPQAPTHGETGAGFYPLVHAGSGGQHAGTGEVAGTAAAAGSGTAADAGAQPAGTQLPQVSLPVPQNFLQRALGAITGDPAPGSPGERQLVQQEQQAAQEEALQQAQEGERQELPAPAQADQAGAAIAQGPATQGAQPPSLPQQQAVGGLTPPTPPSLSPAPAVSTFIIGRHGAALTASQMAAAAALTDRSLLEGQLSLESAGCQSGEDDDRESELHSAGTSSANSSHTNSLVSDPLICLLVGSRGVQVQQRVGPNIKAGTVASKAPTDATAAGTATTDATAADTGLTDAAVADTGLTGATADGTALTDATTADTGFTDVMAAHTVSIDATAAGKASTDATAASTQPTASVRSASPFAEAANAPQQDSGTLSATTRSVDDAAPSPTPSGMLQPRPSMMVDITPWEIEYKELVMIRGIGEGAFGRVYLAKWHETLVAVKVLLSAQDIQEAVLEQALTLSNPIMCNLQKECRLMAAMRHPNVVQFMGVSAMPPAIITEYCGKGSLLDVLKGGRKSAAKAAQLTWSRRLLLALDAAKGILHLHLKNIVHRDLKSPNLLVDSTWRVKVCDFNLSKIIDMDTTSTGTMANANPRWLAPEVLQGQSATTAADVFSFGVVLYELMTWKIPWEGLMPYTIIVRLIDGERLPLPASTDCLPGPAADNAAFAPSLPAYTALVAACWHQDPAQRPTFIEIIPELRTLYEISLQARSQTII